MELVPNWRGREFAGESKLLPMRLDLVIGSAWNFFCGGRLSVRKGNLNVVTKSIDLDLAVQERLPLLDLYL